MKVQRGTGRGWRRTRLRRESSKGSEGSKCSEGAPKGLKGARLAPQVV